MQLRPGRIRSANARMNLLSKEIDEATLDRTNDRTRGGPRHPRGPARGRDEPTVAPLRRKRHRAALALFERLRSAMDYCGRLSCVPRLSGLGILQPSPDAR